MDADESQLEELRDALEVERHTLEEELGARGKVLEGGEWQGSSESEGEEPDAVDAANNIEELATNVPLVKELEKQHRDVVDALKRMDEGTYGTCGKCGDEIPFDRLEANPAARTCIKHS